MKVVTGNTIDEVLGAAALEHRCGRCGAKRQRMDDWHGWSFLMQPLGSDHPEIAELGTPPARGIVLCLSCAESFVDWMIGGAS